MEIHSKLGWFILSLESVKNYVFIRNKKRIDKTNYLLNWNLTTTAAVQNIPAFFCRWNDIILRTCNKNMFTLNCDSSGLDTERTLRRVTSVAFTVVMLDVLGISQLCI